VVPPEAPALAALTRRVKAAMDPAGILNPGRIYGGG
jgi:glycolate oxidase FAD binding subunit